jgi:nicotinate-nucleotide adenylyltransferase
VKLGVLGGTFNPIHLGHLRVAEEVCEALGLDRMILIPAQVPPHKPTEHLESPELRLKLARLATRGNPRLTVSDMELRREGPSYSVDTLRELRARKKNVERLWFVLGIDAYLEIHLWYRFRELFELADVAVMSRPSESSGPSAPDLSALPAPRGMEDQFEATADGGYRHRLGGEIKLVQVTPIGISSTAIRDALTKGRSIRYMVPDNVRRVLESEGKMEYGI